LGRKARGMPLPIGPQASSGAPRRKTRGSLFFVLPPSGLDYHAAAALRRRPYAVAMDRPPPP